MWLVMPFLFADHGATVSLFDIPAENLSQAQHLLAQSPKHAEMARTFDKH